jgi:hypothetical protein
VDSGTRFNIITTWPHEATCRCEKQSAQAHPWLSQDLKQPAERHGLPRCYREQVASYGTCTVHLDTSSNNKDTRKLHTPAFSSCSNGAVTLESPILECIPLKLLFRAIVSCKNCGACLAMEETSEHLLTFPSRGVFSLESFHPRCGCSPFSNRRIGTSAT